ncbi:MAG: hypothetical protein IVW57_06255 [Ktedonobacterales bacterium]|nr:hypothetical protein [Ktedonobacterales bacterium]
MHALETMHTSLRAGGVLLDVRPAPEHPWVEAQRGDSTRRLGQVDDSYRIGTLATSDAALQVLIATGRFVREREQTFTYVYHFDGVDTWLAYMAEHWSTAHVSAKLIRRAREALPSGLSGELRILRAIKAARLKRV